MKKLLTIAVAAIVVSCGSKSSGQSPEQSSEQESSFMQEQPATEGNTEETAVNSVGEERGLEEDVAKNFIANMYNNRLFEDEEFLDTHCSSKLLEKLREAYDYDDSEGYASWLFRSEDQDGPSERHEIIKVESEGNDWYRYEFYDMGTKGAHRIKLLLGANDVITIDDLE